MLVFAAYPRPSPATTGYASHFTPSGAAASLGQLRSWAQRCHTIRRWLLEIASHDVMWRVWGGGVGLGELSPVTSLRCCITRISDIFFFSTLSLVLLPSPRGPPQLLRSPHFTFSPHVFLRLASDCLWPSKEFVMSTNARWLNALMYAPVTLL